MLSKLGFSVLRALFLAALILPSSATPTSKPLSIDVYSIPAVGHYNVMVDLALGLRHRGHNVRFVLCERTHSLYKKDGLSEIGIGLLNAGNCSIMEKEEQIMAKVIQAQV